MYSASSRAWRNLAPALRRQIDSERRATAAGLTTFPAFGPWLATVSPEHVWDWTPPHLRYMQAVLDEVAAGRLKRVMFFCPPRHGKTEQNTIRFGAYSIERRPSTRVIQWCYGQDLASKFSRRTRAIVRKRVHLSTERTAANDWETTQGGGVRAAGIGVGITGMGANLVLVDDPVKSRAEANSPAYREKVWASYISDVYTRLEPDAAIVLTMTRWHEDDLAGRILASEDADNWVVVSIPALAETQEERDYWAERCGWPIGHGDPLGRAAGEALWPARFDAAALLSKRVVMGSLEFGSLYQQHPSVAEGTTFRREWFTVTDALPPNCTFVRYWDKAGTDGAGCYTAGVLMARSPDGRYFVCHVVRGQWSAGQREQVIRQTAEADGRHVAVWVEREPGSGGKESAENTVKGLEGYHARAEPVTGDKVTRAMPLAAQAEIGQVYLIRGAWNREWLDEMAGFPTAKYKDQVDASSGAFNKLALIARPSRSQAGKAPQMWTPGQKLPAIPGLVGQPTLTAMPGVVNPFGR